MKKAILITGGIINIVLGVFHMFFWQLFNWAEELPKLSIANQGILQIANIILIFIILYFGVMSIVMAKKGNIGLYGKSIIGSIIGFYTLRLFLGYPFFGFNTDELAIWAVCLLIITAYGSTFFIKESPAN